MNENGWPNVLRYMPKMNIDTHTLKTLRKHINIFLPLSPKKTRNLYTKGASSDGFRPRYMFGYHAFCHVHNTCQIRHDQQYSFVEDKKTRLRCSITSRGQLVIIMERAGTIRGNTCFYIYTNATGQTVAFKR